MKGLDSGVIRRRKDGKVVLVASWNRFGDRQFEVLSEGRCFLQGETNFDLALARYAEVSRYQTALNDAVSA